MKVIILAGGFGTRISEYTDVIPKPMIPIGENPIIWHIMNRYANYGHNNFYLALGYKSRVLKDYFLNYATLQSDFRVDLDSNKIKNLNNVNLDWKVNLIDTGINSMTGGRLKRLKDHIGKEPFLLTYGDGLSDVDINELIAFHKSHKKMVTVTAVRPSARFGELGLDGNTVIDFKEKPQTDSGWINGGFFVMEPEFLDLIDGDETVLEQYPLERAAAMGELQAFKHKGFWQCMDTKRDKDALNDLYDQNKAPWLI